MFNPTFSGKTCFHLSRALSGWDLSHMFWYPGAFTVEDVNYTPQSFNSLLKPWVKRQFGLWPTAWHIDSSSTQVIQVGCFPWLKNGKYQGGCGLGILRWEAPLVGLRILSFCSGNLLKVQCQAFFNEVFIPALKSWQSCNAEPACHLDLLLLLLSSSRRRRHGRLTTPRFNHFVPTNFWHPSKITTTLIDNATPWPLRQASVNYFGRWWIWFL